MNAISLDWSKKNPEHELSVERANDWINVHVVGSLRIYTPEHTQGHCVMFLSWLSFFAFHGHTWLCVCVCVCFSFSRVWFLGWPIEKREPSHMNTILDSVRVTYRLSWYVSMRNLCVLLGKTSRHLLHGDSIASLIETYWAMAVAHLFFCFLIYWSFVLVYLCLDWIVVHVLCTHPVSIALPTKVDR